MIERRDFLKGLVTTVATGKLILEATDREIQTFGAKLGEETIVQHAKLTNPVLENTGHRLLYNHRGEAVAIAMSYILNMDPHDVTTWSDTERRFIPGPVTYDLQVKPLEPQCRDWIWDEHRSKNITVSSVRTWPGHRSRS